MPTVRQLERRIEEIEGFSVAIRHPDGRDVRGDTKISPRYQYDKAAPAFMTVAGWKRRRFEPFYPRFDIDVKDRRGRGWQPVQGRTLLRTLRERDQE